MREAWFSFEISMMVNDYHLKLEAETFKIDIYDTNFLPFFLFPRPLISSDQMLIGYLLMYIIFYFIFRDAW